VPIGPAHCPTKTSTFLHGKICVAMQLRIAATKFGYGRDSYPEWVFPYVKQGFSLFLCANTGAASRG
jgi:hypothetical protein